MLRASGQRSDAQCWREIESGIAARRAEAGGGGLGNTGLGREQVLCNPSGQSDRSQFFPQMVFHVRKKRTFFLDIFLP